MGIGGGVLKMKNLMSHHQRFLLQTKQTKKKNTSISGDADLNTVRAPHSLKSVV